MRNETRHSMMDGKGPVQLKHIFEPEELGGHCRLFSSVVLPPGSSIGLHMHTKEKEVYYILDGEGEAECNGKTVALKKGDAMIIGDGMTHSIRNQSTGILELLAVIIKD